MERVPLGGLFASSRPRSIAAWPGISRESPAWIDRRVLKDGAQRQAGRGAPERMDAGQHLAQHDAERKEIERSSTVSPSACSGDM